MKVKRGYLNKQGGVRKNWKKRYFEVVDGSLTYFEEKVFFLFLFFLFPFSFLFFSFLFFSPSQPSFLSHPLQGGHSLGSIPINGISKVYEVNNLKNHKYSFAIEQSLFPLFFIPSLFFSLFLFAFPLKSSFFLISQPRPLSPSSWRKSSFLHGSH